VEGTPLVQRADDVEAVFEERMRTYTALTAPVVEHYRAQDRFVEVDGEQPAAGVTAGIMAAVRRFRSQNERR
jgi:adenylate kinase